MRLRVQTVGILVLLVATVAALLALLRPSVVPDAAAGTGNYREAAAQREREPAATDDSALPDATDPETIEDFNGAEEMQAPPGGSDEDHYRWYLVLDDAGHHLDHLRAFAPFPGTFAVAVLPGLEFSSESSRMARAMGHEVILHQPMEALGGNDPGPGAILTSLTDESVAAVLSANLAAVPGIIGVNNHMGSKATSDPRIMHAVAQVLLYYDLFFLDSRTTHLSVAADVARSVGLPTVQRDVFLDNVRSAAVIREQFDLARSVAREQGYAVLIGHVTSPELAAVLIEDYETFTAEGFQFYPLSDLVQRERLQVARARTGN